MTLNSNIFSAAFIASCLVAQAPSTEKVLGLPKASLEKHTLMRVGPNGLPTGHDTPEGVAIDLAAAFISKNAVQFRDTCIPPFGGGENRSAYETFLKNVEASITAEATKAVPSIEGPKSIAKLFAARHLSKGGPASYGFAAFNFQDIMFVDVVVLLHNGNRLMNRTLVIKTSAGKWYVHPAPDTCPLLCLGLNDEAKSEIDFTQAYEIQRP